MHPCRNVVDGLETLYYADEFAVSVTALFSVKHNIHDHQTASTHSC